MILRTVMFAAGLTLIPAVVNPVGWHSRKRCRRPSSADEWHRQYHVAAKADRADGVMRRFMDAALADVEGRTE